MQKCELVKDGEVIVTSERHCGLYKLHIKAIKPETSDEVLIPHKVETLQFWHERLRHQNKRFVDKFLKAHDIKYVRDSQLCEECTMGK